MSRYQINDGETGLSVRNGLNTFLTQTYDFMDLNDAATLEGQAGSYYLDWNNFTNTPTTIAGYGITDAFDGQYNSLIGIPTDVTDLSLHTTDELVEGSTNLYLTNQAQDIYGIKSFQNDTIFYGNITQAGTGTIIYSDTLRVKDALIYTREDATIALGAGEYTGIQAIKYDGTNDGQLVFDKDGWARVGDVGNLQKLATIEETSNSYALSFYNTTTNRLETHQNFKITPFTSTALGSLDIWTDVFRISDTEGVEQVLLEGSDMEINADLILSGKVLISNLTTGFIPYHQSDSVGLVDSLIFIDGTNVGIGTTIPSKKLDVVGNIKASGSLLANDLKLTLRNYKYLHIGGSGDYQKFVILLHEIYDGTHIAEQYANGKLYFERGSISSSYRNYSVNINSKTTYNETYASLESISKDIYQAKLITCSYNGIKYLGVEVNFFVQAIPYISFKGQHYSQTLANPLFIPYYNTNTSIVLNAEINSSITDFVSNNYKLFDYNSVNFNGNLMVGSGAPTEKLDVNGNINTTGIYKLNGSEFHKVTVSSTAPSSPAKGDIWVQP